MFKNLASIFHRDRKAFEAFQVEVSTYSSLPCQICPRDVFAEQWIFRNMEMEIFQKIAKHFHLAKWVIFQGWGEPLENEDIMPMLRVAKEARCSTGLVTNGFHLTETASRQLLSENLDFLLISLQGTPQAGFTEMPLGSDGHRILDQVRRLVDLKKAGRRERPLVKLSFFMTRLNMGKLPALVSLAANAGADGVIFTNLDYLPEERWNILRSFHHESPTPAFQESIKEIHRLGKKLKIQVETYPLKAEEKPVCEANPPQKVFIAADGSIAPCMYLRLPKEGKLPRIFLNKEYQVSQTFFGNIHDEDFLEIWNKGPYKNFRKIFEDRRQAQEDRAQILDALINRKSSSLGKENWLPFPALSEVCRTCYKAYGI